MERITLVKYQYSENLLILKNVYYFFNLLIIIKFQIVVNVLDANRLLAMVMQSYAVLLAVLVVVVAVFDLKFNHQKKIWRTRCSEITKW